MSDSETKARHVLLLGTHGQHNIGDELLLYNFLLSLRKFTTAKIDFYVNSYDPRETSRIFNVRAFHTTGHKLKLIFYIFKADIIVFAGGSILKELYPAYGRRTYSVLNMLVIFMLVARYIARKKVILSNIGIGPISTKEGATRAKFVLKAAHYVSVRDIESLKIALKISPTKEVCVVPDIAFLMNKYDLVGNTKKTTKSRICLNLCRNISDPHAWDIFLDSLIKFFKLLQQHMINFELVGLPMQAGSGADDYKTLTEFKKMLHKHAPDIQFEIACPENFKDAARIIDSSDLLIAERLHAQIIASIIGKPFLSLEYDVKVSSYINDIGYSEYGIKISRAIDEDALWERYEKILKNYDAIQIQLLKTSQQRKVKLEDYFRTLCLQYL